MPWKSSELSRNFRSSARATPAWAHHRTYRLDNPEPKARVNILDVVRRIKQTRSYLSTLRASLNNDISCWCSIAVHDTQDKPADPLITDASARKFAIDNDLGRKCIALLEGLSFPTYKQQVLDYLRALPPQKDADAVCSIVERLDPYRAYNSVDEILRITIVTEDPRAYMHEMMSEESRHRPDFALRGTNNDHGQSATTSTARSEEREDYPEVPPSAMRVYICNICGVNYGSPNELETHHKSTHKQVQSTETKHR